MFYIYRWLGRHRDALVFAEHEKMKHSLSPLSDPIEVLSFFFRSVSGDVGLEFTLIASGSYHIGSSFNRVTSLIKFQIIHEKNPTRILDPNLSFSKNNKKMRTFPPRRCSFSLFKRSISIDCSTCFILLNSQLRAGSNHMV